MRGVKRLPEHGLVLAVEPVFLQTHKVAVFALDRVDQRLRARQERRAVVAFDATPMAEITRREHIERHERERARHRVVPHEVQHLGALASGLAGELDTTGWRGFHEEERAAR